MAELINIESIPIRDIPLFIKTSTFPVVNYNMAKQ